VLPSGRRTRVAAIDTFDGPLDTASAGRSVTLALADDVDVGRGELICHPDRAPALVRELDADVCWMANAPLRPGARYAIKHTTRNARAIVEALHDRVEMHTLAREPAPAELGLNDIGRVRLRLSSPLAIDAYEVNRETGAFILIDETTSDTVGAGMIA